VIPLAAVVMVYQSRESLPFAGQYFARQTLLKKGVNLVFLNIDGDKRCIRIDAHAKGLKDDDLRHLKHFPNVEKLDLSSNQIGDAGLRELRNLRSLKHLSLAGTKITDDGFRSLKDLRSLETLDFHPMPAGHRGGIAGIHGGVSKNTQLSAKCLQHLGGFPELRELVFFIPFDRDLADALETFPKLQLKQEVVALDADDETLSRLARYPDIHSLLIQRGKLEGPGLAVLGKMTHLKLLSILDVEINGDGWRHAGVLSNLRSLIYQSDMDCSALRAIGKRWLSGRHLTMIR
jgi:hypothetical protein